MLGNLEPRENFGQLNFGGSYLVADAHNCLSSKPLQLASISSQCFGAVLVQIITEASKETAYFSKTM